MAILACDRRRQRLLPIIPRFLYIPLPDLWERILAPRLFGGRP